MRVTTVRRQGVPDSGIHVVRAELTVAGFVPGLASLRPQAERSLAQARAAVTSLAAFLMQAVGRP